MHVRVKTCVCKCTGHCVDKFVCEGFLDQHHHLHISPSLSSPTSHHGFCRMFLEGTLRTFDLSLARICGVCLQVCFGATASSSSFLILLCFCSCCYCHCSGCGGLGICGRVPTCCWPRSADTYTSYPTA